MDCGFRIPVPATAVIAFRPVAKFAAVYQIAGTGGSPLARRSEFC